MGAHRPGFLTRWKCLTAAFLLLAPADLPASGKAKGAPIKTAHGPRIVLGVVGGEEREIVASDLRFVYFKRTYSEHHAPRSESPGGRRVSVEDRREQCRCLRFEDWTKLKYVNMRQVEFSYPDDGRQALIRITQKNGTLREVPAEALYGASTSLAPRFTATIDGSVREFPLVLGGEPDERWPEERLVRILFTPPPRPAPTPRHR